MDVEKSVSEMTNEEILRRQLEILSENSIVNADGIELAQMTGAMCKLYKLLTRTERSVPVSIGDSKLVDLIREEGSAAV